MNIAADYMNDDAIVALNNEDTDAVAGGCCLNLFSLFFCKPVYYNPCQPVNPCQPKPPTPTCPTGTCGPTRP